MQHQNKPPTRTPALASTVSHSVAKPFTTAHTAQFKQPRAGVAAFHSKRVRNNDATVQPPRVDCLPPPAQPRAGGTAILMAETTSKPSTRGRRAQRWAQTTTRAQHKRHKHDTTSRLQPSNATRHDLQQRNTVLPRGCRWVRGRSKAGSPTNRFTAAPPQSLNFRPNAGFAVTNAHGTPAKS